MTLRMRIAVAILAILIPISVIMFVDILESITKPKAEINVTKFVTKYYVENDEIKHTYEPIG